MKWVMVYIVSLSFVVLMSSSCVQKQNTPMEQDFSEMCDFEDADIEDGPRCGCEDNVYHLRYIYNTRTII